MQELFSRIRYTLAKQAFLRRKSAVVLFGIPVQPLPRMKLVAMRSVLWGEMILAILKGKKVLSHSLGDALEKTALLTPHMVFVSKDIARPEEIPLFKERSARTLVVYLVKNPTAQEVYDAIAYGAYATADAASDLFPDRLVSVSRVAACRRGASSSSELRAVVPRLQLVR